MQTEIQIRKEDLDSENFYKLADGLNVDGPIKIDPDLVVVRFRTSVKTKKSIVVGIGTRLEAGGSVEAGWSVKAGLAVLTGVGCVATKWVSCLRLVVGINHTDVVEIHAEIRKGDVILGRVVVPTPELPPKDA